MTAPLVARATLDADGLLVAADQLLLSLNERAGGAIGRPLAVVPLATLTRLAARLGVLVARPVTIADIGTDIEVWVRAEPRPDGIDLAVCGWRERAPWRPAPAAAPTSDDGGEGWSWETDAALRLVALSPAMVERTGFAIAVLLGQPLARLFHLEDDAEGDWPILSALGARDDFVGQPATLRGCGVGVTIDGRVRRDVHGRFAGYRGRASEEAVPASETTGLTEAFSGRLERALRAPLARIVATADTINAQADGPLTADYVGYAADIAAAGRHLIDLVDDLADVQAIERPDFAIATEPLDLADVARRAAGLFAVRAGEAGVTVDRPAPDLRLTGSGEFRRVLQILVNRIGNAVRYSPRGATIRVRVEHDGDRALVIVADRGKGIAADDQARIFDKFGRVDASEPGGNGLGLYIARRLARAMGGELSVDSAPGEGARFVLSLPAVASP